MSSGKNESPLPFQSLPASALDALPDLAVVVDRGGQLRYLNRAARTFADGEANDRIGAHVHALFHAPNINRSECTLCTKIARCESAEIETQVTPGQWFRISIIPLEDGESALQVSRDITRRKESELALRNAVNGAQENMRESQLIYEAIMRNASDAIVVANKAGRFIDVNRRAKDLFGYTREEFLRLGPRDIHSEDNQENLRTAFRQMDETGSSLFEHKVVKKDGSIFYAEVSGTRIPWQGSYIYLGSFRDISERKRIDKELRQYREHLKNVVEERTRELRTMNCELEAFSYSVSHDLRSPLRAINGFGEALREELGDKLSKDSEYFLERMRLATVRMGELIDGLLNLSQVSRSELRVVEVDLRVLALHIIATLRESEPAREVRFEVEADLKTLGDQTLLQVLMENLLNNAWKFTEKVAHAHIVVGRERRAEGTVFYVRDNGAGFDQQFAHKLFKPFERLHQGEFRGTGIGLATVRRIVERHGGTVWAEGEPDRGATIYFSLAVTKVS